MGTILWAFCVFMDGLEDWPVGCAILISSLIQCVWRKFPAKDSSNGPTLKTDRGTDRCNFTCRFSQHHCSLSPSLDNLEPMKNLLRL